MEKIYINDRQDFIEWKARCNKSRGYGEREPLSYPCILIEIDEYDNTTYDIDRYYGFVYLTDFIHDYGN